MESRTTTPLSTNPNPNPNRIFRGSAKAVLPIGGIEVEFPYQPYGSQLAFMGRVISTLDRAVRDGRCHALLESPTGTGKSLSLLCSALAWQQNHRSRRIPNHSYGNLSHSSDKPIPDEALVDPLRHGGGFVPEMEPSGNLEAAPFVMNNKSKKKRTSPTIFYASRTHSQITQLIREYKKTAYRVPMAILASRKHYCTNKHIRGEDDIDERCKLLLKNPEAGCFEFKNVNKVKGHPSLQKGGCHEVHDVEDLVKVGQVVKGCSYFAARSMAEDAQLVFCPYSYVINPVIRRAMEVDIEGAIVIFDEAHNIEDMARDAGSVDVDEDVLLQLQMELGQLCQSDAMTYQPLHEMIEDIIGWIAQKKNRLEKHEFQHYVSCWTGDKALRELQEANITEQCFLILKDCASMAIKAASDAEVEVAHLSGMSANSLEGLFSSLSYFFSGNGIHIFDYLLVLRRYIKKDPGNITGEWTCTFSLWCLNPGVVFKDIADISLSVILTSGTLSPMNSFSSELGVHFGTCLEAPHVINAESQLWAAVVSNGPGDYPLNASYRTADGFAFQDALGASLEEICKIVPGGCLIFFPSYKLLEKLCSRWSKTGQWSRLNAQKSLFVEPRGGNQDEFENVLKGYYDSIRQSRKSIAGQKRPGKKLDAENGTAVECTTSSGKGSALLAVCRGKVSEGIDFSDENARAVIIVGIPFPNVVDIQVAQKKKYNDTFRLSNNLLSGSEWYCQQAFRALNQAAGRCIRHRFDYGAIIFLDERFREERNTRYFSKWLRKSIRQYDSFVQPLEELKSFFRDAKVTEMSGSLHPIDLDRIEPTDPRKGFAGKSSKKLMKSNQRGQKLVSSDLSAPENDVRIPPTATSPKCFASYQSGSEIQPSVLTSNTNDDCCREYIDLDCDLGTDSRVSSTPFCRCSCPPSRELYHIEPELSIVKETPGMGGSFPAGTSKSISKDDAWSGSTIVHSSTRFPNQPLSHLVSSSGPFSESNCAHSLVTPEKAPSNTKNQIPETESPLNLSVNSHTQKGMRSLSSPFLTHLAEGQFDSPNLKIPDHVSSIVTSMTMDHTNCAVDCGHGTANSNIPRAVARGSCETLSSVLSGHEEKKLQIFCSMCRTPLGLSESNFYVPCLLASSSKIFLVSLWQRKSETPALTLSSVPIVLSDVSSVDCRLHNRTAGGAAGEGIWSREDGCVFNPIFCPFCSTRSHCLGLQVMATDSSNLELLNKVLFYFDRLEIGDLGHVKNKDFSPSRSSCIGGSAVLDSIEKSAYSPKQQNSGGWRSTRSKIQLPKNRLFSTPKG